MWCHAVVAQNCDFLHNCWSCKEYCISTAVQKSADDTFIIHKHMKECSVKGLITNSTRPSMFIVLKYMYIVEFL